MAGCRCKTTKCKPNTLCRTCPTWYSQVHYILRLATSSFITSRFQFFELSSSIEVSNANYKLENVCDHLSSVYYPLLCWKRTLYLKERWKKLLKEAKSNTQAIFWISLLILTFWLGTTMLGEPLFISLKLNQKMTLNMTNIQRYVILQLHFTLN